MSEDVKEPMSFRASPDKKAQLKAEAKRQGKEVSELMNEYMELGLKTKALAVAADEPYTYVPSNPADQYDYAERYISQLLDDIYTNHVDYNKKAVLQIRIDSIVGKSGASKQMVCDLIYRKCSGRYAYINKLLYPLCKPFMSPAYVKQEEGEKEDDFLEQLKKELDANKLGEQAMKELEKVEKRKKELEEWNKAHPVKEIEF